MREPLLDMKKYREICSFPVLLWRSGKLSEDKEKAYVINSVFSTVPFNGHVIVFFIGLWHFRPMTGISNKRVSAQYAAANRG
jgi:hypothetical protein